MGKLTGKVAVITGGTSGIALASEQPAEVDVNEIIIRPTAQA